MENKELEIVWDKLAVSDFYKILDYLNESAPHATEKVVDKIVESVKKLSTFPLLFQQDRFKNDNDGSYRALVVYSYRIGYKVTSNSILILRIRHVSQEPLNY